MLFLDINNFFDYNFIEEIINEIDKTFPDILIFRYELYNETSEIFYTDNYSYETIWPNKYLNYSSIPYKLKIKIYSIKIRLKKNHNKKLN